MDKREEVIVAEKFVKMCAESLRPHRYEEFEDYILPALEKNRHIRIRKAEEIPLDGDHLSEQSFLDYTKVPSHAWSTYNEEHKYAHIGLSKEWNYKPTVKEIRLSAFHEVMEVVMGPLVIMACTRWNVSDFDITSRTHEIIRRFENILFK